MGLTFAIVFGVIIYRISTAAALAISSTPSGRSSVRVTVTATAVIINLVVIIILDEVYGCIARWLTQIGRCRSSGICWSNYKWEYQKDCLSLLTSKWWANPGNSNGWLEVSPLTYKYQSAHGFSFISKVYLSAVMVLILYQLRATGIQQRFLYLFLTLTCLYQKITAFIFCHCLLGIRDVKL